MDILGVTGINCVDKFFIKYIEGSLILTIGFQMLSMRGRIRAHSKIRMKVIEGNDENATFLNQ